MARNRHPSALGGLLCELGSVGRPMDLVGTLGYSLATAVMDGAILVRLHHNQWCWQLRMGVQQEVIGGRWWLGNSSLDARGPGVGPLQLSNAH